MRLPLNILLTMLATWCIVTAQAQYTSRLGRFQVDQVKGCDSLAVNIIINTNVYCDEVTNKLCACDGSNACDMEFGDSDDSQNLTFTHTYTQPGRYKLRILFQTHGYDSIYIEVFPNTPPSFELYACNNNEISVNITDTNYDQYIINYNDGNPEITWSPGNPDPQNTGSKTVSVRGINTGAADNCNSNTQAITALATLPAPTITQLQVMDNTSIRLDYDNLPNILYRLEIATNSSTSFQFYKTSYNLTSDIITNLKADDNYYCFRLGAFSPCDNQITYSDIICSANVDLNIQNNLNTVSWVTNTTGAIDLQLSKTTAAGNFTIPVTSSPYNDTDLVCGTSYCYQLITNYPNGSRSLSLEKCGTAISTDIPGPVENITAVVDAPGVTLQWQPVAGYTPSEFSVFKSEVNVYNLLTKTTGTETVDATYTTESAACYKLSYVDICGNESPPSIESCPIRLSGQLQKDNSIQLIWTPYSGWRDGVSGYSIEKYSQDGQLMQTINAGAALTYLDDAKDLSNQTYRYVIKAIAFESGLPQAVSNTVTLIKNPNLFYPTAFTPNGDNLNDIFTVNGQYIQHFEMNIFNRWGELMFTTRQIEDGWNGYYKGNPMPEGTYTFVADITDHAGRTFKKSGSVMLLRKK